MHKVHLDEFVYPCAHYALQRSGLSGSIAELMSAFGEEFFENTLRAGDIVVWDCAHHTEEVAVTILECGRVVTSQVRKAVHYGVYEGGGLVSDLTFVEGSAIPKIRVRVLSELKQPDRVITRVVE